MNKIIIFALFSLLVLQACETQRVVQPTTGWDDPLWQQHYQQLKPIQKYSLKGRIGITNPEDSFSSNFRWQQKDFKDFEFRMYGAFGNTYVMMKSTPDWTTLETGDERFFEGPDASELIIQTMGWPLPLNYLSDWIKGVPTGVGRDEIKINADGTLQSLSYHSNHRIFNVSFEKYGQFQDKKMPTKIRILESSNKLILSIRSWEI